MRSTPTEIQSMSENDFEYFASTGVKAPVAMFPNAARFNFFETETLPLKR